MQSGARRHTTRRRAPPHQWKGVARYRFPARRAAAVGLRRRGASRGASHPARRQSDGMDGPGGRSCLRAQAAAWVRVASPSLPRMLATCVSAVRSEMISRRRSAGWSVPRPPARPPPARGASTRPAAFPAGAPERAGGARRTSGPGDARGAGDVGRQGHVDGLLRGERLPLGPGRCCPPPGRGRRGRGPPLVRARARSGGGMSVRMSSRSRRGGVEAHRQGRLPLAERGVRLASSR